MPAFRPAKRRQGAFPFPFALYLLVRPELLLEPSWGLRTRQAIMVRVRQARSTRKRQQQLGNYGAVSNTVFREGWAELEWSGFALITVEGSDWLVLIKS